MGRWMEERCWVEERHCFGGWKRRGKQRPEPVRLTFKRFGGGPDARSAIGTLSPKQSS